MQYKMYHIKSVMMFAIKVNNNHNTSPGIGIGTTIMVFLCNVYYIVLLAWGLHYLFVSAYAAFTSGVLPWATCGNEWNTEKCFSTYDLENGDATETPEYQNGTDSVVEYWE